MKKIAILVIVAVLATVSESVAATPIEPIIGDPVSIIEQFIYLPIIYR